jgi:hypothetical protein
MAPFRNVAAKVEGSRRVAYTEAGGLKIGRPKSDPDYKWIDTYSAIKTEKLNAYFVCYVPKPGDEPVFRLSVDDKIEGEFFSMDLERALDVWRAVAQRAGS